jgi:hypothetical protein
MRQPLRLTAGIVILVLADARVARAGMPMATLSEIASMRLEAISFFLIVFLMSSGLVWKIWNSARKDFPRLPHLSYWRATCHTSNTRNCTIRSTSGFPGTNLATRGPIRRR